MNDDELRDRFGAELTDALRARSRPTAHPDPAGAVAQHVRRVRTRRRIFAATAAAVIGATGTALIVSRTHSTAQIDVAGHPSSTAATAPPLPDSHTTGVADWTWVSAEHGWALVRQPCGATVCMSLRETTDGGRTWTPVRLPEVLDLYAQTDAGAACATHTCVSGVRFANSRIGWLFGPAFLQTADGGRTWKRIPGRDVVDVEASENVAVRLTAGTDCGNGCTYGIERERLGTAAWKPVSTPIAGDPSLIILGRDVYAVSVPDVAGSGRGELRHSNDAGLTWEEIKDPCAAGGADHVTTSASAAPNGVFVVLCSARSQPGSPFVRISTDRGRSFGARHDVPTDASGVVRAASARTLLVGDSAGDANAVLVSRDGGGSWHPELRLSPKTTDSVALGWENPQTARASFDTDGIWTTRDAGQSWTRNAVTP